MAQFVKKMRKVQTKMNALLTHKLCKYENVGLNREAGYRFEMC